jgi:hypothetical protein
LEILFAHKGYEFHTFRVQLHLLRPFASLNLDRLVDIAYDLLAKTGIKEATYEEDVIGQLLHTNNDRTLTKSKDE